MAVRRKGRGDDDFFSPINEMIIVKLERAYKYKQSRVMIKDGGVGSCWV